MAKAENKPKTAKKADSVPSPEASVMEKGKGQKRGRKCKYDEYVKPMIPKIKEWAASGATEKEICTSIGVALSSFYEYKKAYPELAKALREGRQKVILEIKAALFKKATGFMYEEKRGVKKNGQIVNLEVSNRYCPPDPVAAAMLLRNYDEEWRDKDSKTTDFKKQELELKKAMAEASNWDLDPDKDSNK